MREVVLHRPEVAVLDLQMPGLDGFAATRAIARVGAGGGRAGADDVRGRRLGLRRDAGRGPRLLVKGAEQEEIGRAIRAVAAGEAIFGPGVAQRVLTFFATPPPAADPFPQLTGREREILDLLALALPNSVIATRLDLSPKTVANHLSSIFTKIQVADRAAAILRAREAGLGALPPALLALSNLAPCAQLVPELVEGPFDRLRDIQFDRDHQQRSSKSPRTQAM